MIDGKQGNAEEQPIEDPGRIPVRRRRYFSSTEGPFQSANNIYLFYGGADRSLIANAITHRLRKFQEPVIVSGESGSGKTMMSLVLAHRLQQNFKVIQFDHKRCDFDRLLRQLLIELTPDLTHVGTGDTIVSNKSVNPYEHDQDEHLLVTRLMSRLQLAEPLENPVLLIIDARVIEPDALKLIRQLTAVVNAHGHPVSAVIFLPDTAVAPAGQHDRENTGVEARSSLDAGRMSEVGDAPESATTRFTLGVGKEEDWTHPPAHYVLRRLNLAETTEYLNHHMLLFDFNKRDLFAREMAYFIADRSAGNCSAINNLARNAFLQAHVEGAEQVTMGHVLVAGMPERQEKRAGFFSRHKRAVSMTAAFVVSSLLVGGVLAGVFHFLA